MFKKTRMQLILLNSIVVFLILSVFGATVYIFTEHRLYNQATENLSQAAEHTRAEKDRDLFRPRDEDRQDDPRLFYVLWGGAGTYLGQSGGPGLATEDVKRLRTILSAPQQKVVQVHGEPMAVMSVPANAEGRVLTSGTSVSTIQLVYRLGGVRDMLDNLLTMIEIGVVAGALASVLIGAFLANRALIPIQRSWNRQQQFVADASHELRTPLSVMRVQLEQLFRHPTHTIEAESERISAVIDETKRVTKLVANLLTLARSDSNALQISHDDVRLDEILDRVATQFSEIASLKNITVQNQSIGVIQVRGDGERLQQLFVILLDNAIKYTNPGGTVVVEPKKQAQSVDVVIRDTGIGIPADDLPFIFDRFYRGDKMRSHREHSSGLGLSIARWIVEAHGGRIRVDSIEGQGTRVVVTFPSRLRA